MLSTIMDSTIGVLKSVDVDGVITTACEFPSGNLAIGNNEGKIMIINKEGLIEKSFEVEGIVVGLLEIDGNIIVGSSISGISCYSEVLIWNHDLKSGCEIISLCGSNILVAGSNGILFKFNNNGEIIWSKEFGEISNICSNQKGDISAIALENGNLLIIDDFGEIISESTAPLDDIETISSMVFRTDDILVVARNSLGMTIDDRPENRIECWSSNDGIIHSCEVDSLVKYILPTSKGVILGCFEGEILELEVESKSYNLLSILEYSITQIFPWKEDFLIASWFDVKRISPKGEIIWNLEHAGVIGKIVQISDSKVAILGDNKKQNIPTPVFIINPESEIISNDFDRINEDDFNDLRYSGSLSSEEEVASSMRPSLPSDSSEIIEALEEELEIELSPPAIEIDILEDLSSSANSLNLPPIVDVGEDRTVNSGSDGTAIVLLDGSRSYDPDGHITTWSWENESGKIISDNSQVRVKLPRGVHIFYLTIVDDKGSSSKATLTIRVI